MKKICDKDVEFKVVAKGTYWEVRQKVYLFGIIPYWSKFYWGADELGRYATKAQALVGMAEYIAARDKASTAPSYYTAEDIRNNVYIPQPPTEDY
ncbi:hypothetical protein [Escherichia coli]|uniref:hypothetical protein n=1 Tax=Escherichia coli TaxID=562 RepID=UPI000CFB6776|nr:hypothetical protein [Escherichia coli]